jgi:hypothetical protein
VGLGSVTLILIRHLHLSDNWVGADLRHNISKTRVQRKLGGVLPNLLTIYSSLRSWRHVVTFLWFIFIGTSD